jgi:uncharacterized membrane protein
MLKKITELILKQLFRYIFVGALALVPLFLVIQLLVWINNLSVDMFKFVSTYTNSSLYTAGVFILTIVILAFIGSSIERAGKSYLISLIDKILAQVPAINNIYSIIKKITALFTPNNKEAKKEVVLVEYPKDECWVPAYELNKYNDILVLFIPTSPNPTSGYTVIIDEQKVIKTSLSVAEASQFIVSMGADFIKKEEISKLIKKHKVKK